MKQTVIACVCSSLLTVGILSVMGFGPLNPPPGPVAPTSVSLDQLAAAIASVQPVGSNIPGSIYANGGSATFAREGQGAVTVPLIGYSAEFVRAVPGLNPPSNATVATTPATNLALITVAVEGGRYGGVVAFAGSMTVTIHGSDGTTIGPFYGYQYTRKLTNGPTAAGNKCVDVVTFFRDPGDGPLQASDPSGSSRFGQTGGP